MKISMTPNPMIRESVSCSQYDTGRKFEFELYDGDGVIDTSNVTDQMAFYSRKDGMEQILPINGSVPVTTPIEADIQYPDMVRSDQEFFTRESPVTKDGSAKITSLQGKTLVWNQLCSNGNFASNWTYSNASGSVSNNVLTFTATATNGYTRANVKSGTVTNGHKYLGTIDVKCTSSASLIIYFDPSANNVSRIGKTFGTDWETASIIWTSNTTGDNWYPRVYDNRASGWDAIQLRNAMIFDLTQMYGEGNEPTTPEEFRSYYPLPWYSYDTGSLLNFTGTKLKTTGKNLSDKSSIICSATGYINASNSVLTKVFKGNTYTISFDNLTTLSVYIIVRVTPDGASYNVDQTRKTLTANKRCDITFTATDTGNLWLSGQATGYSSVKVFDNIQVEFGSTPSVYEAYVYNETDLPISTFFPTGMKSAGSVYDEITETSYITRIASVDLGQLTWTATTNNRYITTGIASVIKAPVNNQTVANILCEKYTAVTYSDIVDNSALGIAVNANIGNVGNICIRDTGTYADAAAFKTAMNGVRLYYELATPLENYGVVDLGSLTWTYDSQNTVFRGAVSGIKRQAQEDLANLVCSMYRTNKQNQVIGMNADMCISTLNWGDYVVVRNNAYSDASVFKAAMSGVYLLYEKAESHQLESASIVTADGEKPLSPEDGKLVCTIDENITSNPGMYEAKISYSKDGKKNYSNKFQIYVERSPE